MKNSEVEKLTLCVACQQELHPKASTCPHCGTYQGLRRYVFQFSSVVVALLSLAPLWGIAVALYSLAFPGGAELRMLATACASRQVTFAVENIGGATGLLGPASVEVVRDGSIQSTRIELRTESERMVTPGQTRQVSYTGWDGLTVDFPQRGTHRQCELRFIFDVLEFDGSVSKSQVGCPCP